jgi:hypothetical protein
MAQTRNFTWKNTLRDIRFAEFKWLRQIWERRVAFVRFLREEAKSDIIQQFRNVLRQLLGRTLRMSDYQ